MPDPTPPRKHRRLGLYIPIAVLLVGIAAWTFAWFAMSGTVDKRVIAARESLRKAGYDVTWSEHRVTGYPFRMDVTLVEPRIRDVSGWALAAPRLEAEAYILTPGSWIVAAPLGLEFVRPVAGPVKVRGERLRASLTHLDKHPPNFSFEAVKAAFEPGPGAQPFALAGADRVEFHLRAGPNDEAGVFATIEGGKPRAGGVLARAADGKTVALTWNSTLSKFSAFQGDTWPTSVRAWANAGGRMNLRNGGLTAGDASLGAQAGTLFAGPDGLLRGDLDLSVRQAPKFITALAETGAIPPEAAVAATAVVLAREAAGATRVPVVFEAGRTTIGPVAVAPAPHVY